ncbi:hypothetical protein [Ideonella sp. BN130291]|uniref:hypothetical protein n=1 Tax=Ideonella sp. BN130291 TaxID=3112940 RepID=UPI002E26419B|nr:hypothetical protein [Ideonella sp. BN130291]
MSIPLSPDAPLRAVAALLLAAWTANAPAADALDQRTERERVANERQRVESQYAAQVRQCESQFIITSCIEQARADRRLALEHLAQQQSVLDEALRKQRAAAQLERLQEKQREAALKRAAPAQPRVVQRQAAVASAASAAEARVASAPAVARHEEPGAAHPPALSAAERERNEAAYRQRQKEAAAHREELARRNAARAQVHKPAASLPIPAAVAASAAR